MARLLPSPDTLAADTLALACATARPDEEAACLRRVVALLCAARVLPAGLRHPDPQRVEALLGVNAHAQLALEWLDGVCGLMLSRGSAGLHLATLLVPARSEATASASTSALAIAAVVAEALADAAVAVPH